MATLLQLNVSLNHFFLVDLIHFIPQAKHIQFDPIRACDVTLPEEIVFVIANSLVCSEIWLK